MNKLLHIIATPREEESRTLQISHPFLELFQKTHPDWTIDELNLSKEPAPSLSMKRVDGKYLLLNGKDLYGDLKEAWQEIVQHIKRFLSADMYLISTPMWNYSVPYMLKNYIDVIIQPKYLFRYTKGGAEGLVKNKKMIVLTSRGGDYTTLESKGDDFQEPYLRKIFGLVGITDISFVNAQPMDMGEEIRQQKLQEAIGQAQRLVMNLKEPYA